MRILAIYRHYWPDTTPYARLLRGILEHLTGEGHAATVYAAQPSYNDLAHARQARRETLGGVDIHRLRLLPERKRLKILRAVNFCYFLARAILHAVWHRNRYDLIVANTHPPVLMGFVLRLIKRLTGIPYLLHCQDVHPESAVLANQLGEGRLSRTLLQVDTKSCREAKAVVTLSRDMHDQLVKRGGYTGQNVRVINNYPLDRYDEPASIPDIFKEYPRQPFYVLFAGNMGLFQSLERLVEAARLLNDLPQVHFIFMGTGAVRDRLVELAAELVGQTVFFEPFQPVETAFACMQRSDLGVVSLAEDVYRVAYPSKTMTYLAAGCPVLVLVESHSNVAQEMMANDFGYVPAKGTPEQIAETIRFAWQDRHRWTPEARCSLVQRSNRHFGREQALAHWSKLIASLDLEQETLNKLPRSQAA